MGEWLCLDAHTYPGPDGIGLSELATVFDNLRPDAVVTIADRYETLATAVAASYMNIPVVHVQGGEVTGSIDEKVRHAVTCCGTQYRNSGSEVSASTKPGRTSAIFEPRTTIVAFFIGASLSRKSLAAVGVRPLILGVVLWILISAAGLWAVMTTLA